MFVPCVIYWIRENYKTKWMFYTKYVSLSKGRKRVSSLLGKTDINTNDSFIAMIKGEMLQFYESQEMLMVE